MSAQIPETGTAAGFRAAAFQLAIEGVATGLLSSWPYLARCVKDAGIPVADTTTIAEILPQIRRLAVEKGNLSEEDLDNLWAMQQTVVGGGVAPVSEEDAKRLARLGLVKLGPAREEDLVPGEIEPEYTFSLTQAGEEAVRDYRAPLPQGR